MKQRLVLTAVLFATLITFALPATAAEPADNPAIKPIPREAWWMSRHEAKLKELAEAKGDIDLVFIGDSITHGWENSGKEIWAERYAPRKAFNIGYSGDRTEHVLWRLDQGELDGIKPKLAVMMIGTNNIGHGSSTPEQTVIGVKKILDVLGEKQPQMKVLLLAVFPRGANKADRLRQAVDKINEGLPALADGERVHFLDIGPKFLADDGETLPREIMPDLLHPRAEGYKIWADAIEPSVKKLMGE